MKIPIYLDYLHPQLELLKTTAYSKNYSYTVLKTYADIRGPVDGYPHELADASAIRTPLMSTFAVSSATTYFRCQASPHGARRLCMAGSLTVLFHTYSKT